jgi:hypothetical protein
MTISDDFINGLRKISAIAFYFRYPLHQKDFRELKDFHKKTLGFYASKPLYGKLTASGKVDRRSGFNGQIAILFIPAGFSSAKDAKIFFTRTKPQIIESDGKRNWKVIRTKAEQRIRRVLKNKESG